MHFVLSSFSACSKICVMVFPVRLWLNDITVRPNTSNILGVVRAIDAGKRVETKSLSPSPTVNQTENFRDYIYIYIYLYIQSFSFTSTDSLTKAKESSLPYYLLKGEVE